MGLGNVGLASGSVGVGLAFVLTACTVVPPSTALLTPTNPPATIASAPPSPSPPASASVLLDPEDLPEANLKEEDATLLCDPEASQFDLNAGDTLLFCYDGLLLGLRALKTGADHFDRLYLQRAICASIPCTPAELGTVTVTGWTDGAALSVVIDHARSGVTVPAPDSEAMWPTPSSTESASVARPEIDGAPKVVRQREPYPYCGAVHQDRLPALRCFLDAMLRGTPAEMLDRSRVSGEIRVFRFDGQGLIERYAEFPDGWLLDGGSAILGSAGTWSYDGWLEAEPVP
jgi:hypothetical protein